MRRTLLALALGLALSGCWMSEEQFFGPDDYAHLDFNGSYTNEDANGHEQATVELTTRPDGLIEGTSTNIEGGKAETLASRAGADHRRFGRILHHGRTQRRQAATAKCTCSAM